MDYSQKIQNDANEIQHLSDAFEELRITLDVLTALDLNALDDRIGMSIQRIIHQAFEQIDAIECKVAQCYTEKE